MDGKVAMRLLDCLATNRGIMPDARRIAFACGLYVLDLGIGSGDPSTR